MGSSVAVIYSNVDSSRTRSRSQHAVVNGRCVLSGLAPPACSASDQLALRSSPDSMPPGTYGPGHVSPGAGNALRPARTPHPARPAGRPPISLTLAITVTLRSSVPAHLKHLSVAARHYPATSRNVPERTAPYTRSRSTAAVLSPHTDHPGRETALTGILGKHLNRDTKVKQTCYCWPGEVLRV